LRLFSFGGYGLALAALALVVFGAYDSDPFYCLIVLKLRVMAFLSFKFSKLFLIALLIKIFDSSLDKNFKYRYSIVAKPNTASRRV